MPRYSGTDIVLTINAVPYVFPPRAIDDFPDAKAFLEHLINQGRATAATAIHYVKIAARMHRTGRFGTAPQDLANVNERTVAKAYKRWSLDAYAQRVQAVARAFKTVLPNAGSVAWLRRGSLVPPSEGKYIPVPQLPAISGSLTDVLGAPPTGLALVPMTPVQGAPVMPEPAAVEWAQAPGVWTLHVPPDATTPVHTDPCSGCTAIIVSDEQLEVIAAAFEQAWGHRDLNKVDPAAFLFGAPPPDYNGDDVVRETVATGRVLALVKPGPLADSLRQLGATVVRGPEEFVERAAEHVPDTVVISRELCSDARILDAMQGVWDGQVTT